MSRKRQQQLTLFQETFPLEQQQERLAIQLHSALELIQRISYLNIYQDSILGKYTMYKQEQIKKELEQQLILGIDPFDASARINEQILKGWLIDSEQKQVEKYARDGNTNVDIDFINDDALKQTIQKKEQQTGVRNDLTAILQLLTEHLQSGERQPMQFQYGPQSQQDQISQAQSQQQLLQNDTEQDQEEIKEEQVFNGQELLQQLNQQQQQQIFSKAKSKKKVDFNETRSNDTTRQMIQPARQRQQQQNDEDLTLLVQGEEAKRVPRESLNRSILQDETQLRARSPIGLTTAQNIFDHLNDIELFGSQVQQREQMPRTRAPSTTFEKISDIVQEEEKKQLVPENENIDDFQDALQDLQTPQEKEIETRNKQIDERIKQIEQTKEITQKDINRVEEKIQIYKEGGPLKEIIGTIHLSQGKVKQIQDKMTLEQNTAQKEQYRKQIEIEQQSIPIRLTKKDGTIKNIESRTLVTDLVDTYETIQNKKEHDDYAQIFTGKNTKIKQQYLIYNKERINKLMQYLEVPEQYKVEVAKNIKEKLKIQVQEAKNANPQNKVATIHLSLSNEYLMQILQDSAGFISQSQYRPLLGEKIQLDREIQELSAKKGITLTNV